MASLGQNLLLKFKKICIKAEQSIPLKDFPPHLYLIFLKILIFLKKFFSLNETGFTSPLYIHPSENFKNLAFLSITFILDQKTTHLIFFL